MRITYRGHQGNRAYWQKRWDDVEADSGDLNLQRYPGKFADWTMRHAPEGPVLEAGCGAGRVVMYYHRQGRAMVGMEFIASALDAIHQREPEIPLVAGDVRRLPFPEGTFGAVLAFGLYHNLEQGLEEALADTRKVLKEGGLLCASMRVDNIQNRITDHLAARNSRGEAKSFHKINLTKGELERAFRAAGFTIERLEYVENMPFLYKFSWFRHRTHRVFDEVKGRSEGYRLAPWVEPLQRFMMRFWPHQFSNVAVITARA